MKFNNKKFFELAKEMGFEAVSYTFNHSKSLSFSIFNKQVDSFSNNEVCSITSKGIINGKFGLAVSEKFDKETPEFLLNTMKETARLVEVNEPAIIYKGDKHYSKKNVFNPKTLTDDVSKKIELLKSIEEKLLAYDKRINMVAAVGYEESLNDSITENSYGLKLKDKMATCTYYAEVTAKEGEEVKTGFKVFASLNPDDFDVDKFVEDVAKDALSKLGAVQCKSKKYPVVLDPQPLSSLLRAYLSNMDAEEIQKKSSLFIGKLHQPIANKKLTVIEDSTVKNVLYNYHDDEGVALKKKFLVKKGILETYLYTLKTAQMEGVEPTGNGYGVKAKASLGHIIVKPGKKSFDEMIKNIKEGVLITNVEGLHAGLNAQSGNFSLQSQGFMIRDGKVAEPLSLITLAGNLQEMFMSIKDIANDSTFKLNGVTTPSIYFKKLAVSGK